MKRLLCLLLLCSWNAAVWSQGPPLVKNGGFEMADENGFPLHWQPVQGERPVQFEAELVPRSTEKGSCLSLEVATNAPWTMQGTVEGALRENQSYLFSCEAMTEEWSGIIQINLYREGGTLQDRIATLSLTRTDDWRPLTATVRVSRQTQPIVRIEGERGCKIRLDNIAISPLLYGRQPEAPNAPRAYRVTDLSRRVGILLQAEDLLEEGPEWTEEGQENSDQWVLTSIDFFADLWMEGQVLRSPKNSRPETLLSLRIAHLLPGKYWLFLSDPGGALEARWNGGEWKRLQGGKGEARWGHVELGETPVLFEVRTPPAGEDTALPCYLDYLRLLPDFQQADRIVAKQPSISPPLRDPVPLQGQLAGKAPFLPVPLRVGVPLPMGGVRDAAALSLKTDKATLPSQAEVFSRWPDESPRWSMVRTVVPPDLWTKSGVDLDFKASDTQAGEPYRVKEKDGLIKVVGGGLEMALDGTTGEMVRLGMDKDGNGEVDAKENLLASPGYLRVEMPTTKSALTNVFLPRLDSHEIESEGSLYLRVKCQGVLSSFVLEHELNYCLRWECYAGIPGFRYELFLWSEEDENTLSVWDVSWVFPLSRGDSLRYCFPTDSNHFVNGEVRSGEGVTLLQKNYHEYEIQASTEAFQETFHSGQSHPGWASFGCDSGYLVVQTDHFREMHPSSFELGEAGASVGFLPSEQAFEDPTKWFDGTGRTCSGWILLLDREKPRDLKRWFEAATQWPVLTPTAEWVEGCLPSRGLPTQDQERFFLYERMVEFSFEQAMNRVESWDDTGFFDFGDHTLAKRGQAAHWSNVRFALPHVLITEGLRRNGDARFLRRAVAAALHQADVDMDHRQGGVHLQGMGHTLAPLRTKQAWARSYLDASHLEGSPRFQDASSALGDWLLRVLRDDPFQLVQSCEDAAAALSTFTDLYRETGEEKYWNGMAALYVFVRRWQDRESGLWYSPNDANPRIYAVQMDEAASLLLALTELGYMAEAEGLEELLSSAAEGLLHRAAHPGEGDSPDLSRIPFFKILLARAVGTAAYSLGRRDLAEEAMRLFDRGIQDGNFLGRDFDVFANVARQTPRFLARCAKMDIYPSGDKSLFFHPIHFGSLFADESLSFHPFSLAAPPKQWRFLIKEESDQPFEVTVYKERLEKGCEGELFLEDVYRHLIQSVKLTKDGNEKATLKMPADQQTGVYQVRIVDQGPNTREGSSNWSVAVNPSLPLVLEVPTAFRLNSLEPVNLFFRVPPEEKRLWCRVFLRKAGGVRVQFLGPDGEVLAKNEIIAKRDPGPEPDWQDLVAELPTRDQPLMFQIQIEGKVDVLLQLRLDSRYVCTDPSFYFQPEERGPWER